MDPTEAVFARRQLFGNWLASTKLEMETVAKDFAGNYHKTLPLVIVGKQSLEGIWVHDNFVWNFRWNQFSTEMSKKALF